MNTKEIKAYVRVNEVQIIVSTLEGAGFCCITIIDVSGLGNLADPYGAKYSMEFIEKYSKMARIELMCRNENEDTIVHIIQRKGCTHQSGDGIIFVLPVDRAMKIKTAEEGDQILQT